MLARTTLLGGARSSVRATYGLESHSRPGTCSADDGVGGPTAELVRVGKKATTAASPPKARVDLFLALSLGWHQPRSVAQTPGTLGEHDLRDADGASEPKASGTWCIRQRTRPYERRAWVLAFAQMESTVGSGLTLHLRSEAQRTGTH